MCLVMDRDKVIEENLPLVHHVLRKHFKNRLNEYDDLFQAGCIGLIKAVDRYNPDTGALTTYAYTCILSSMRLYLRENIYTIRFSKEYKELFLSIIKNCTDLKDEEELKKVSNFLGVSLDKVKKTIKVYTQCTQFTYLDEEIKSVKGEKDMSRHDIVADNDGYEPLEAKMMVKEILNKIDSYHADILTMYYFQDMKQQEIADIVGKTQVQVSRDIMRAIESANNVVNGKSPSIKRSNTREITHDGKTMNITEWAKYLGINRGTVMSRLSRGYSEKAALGF